MAGWRRTAAACHACLHAHHAAHARPLLSLLLSPSPAGRLDRKIEFPLPDRRQKRLVFQVRTKEGCSRAVGVVLPGGLVDQTGVPSAAGWLLCLQPLFPSFPFCLPTWAQPLAASCRPAPLP